MKRGKPTIDEIKEQVAKCDRIYGPLWSEFQQDDNFYELNFKKFLNIPTQFADDRVIVPTARDVVDAAVNHTDIINARVYVNKKSISDISERSAEMLRKLALGIIHRTNVEAQIVPGHIGAKHFWLYGLAVFKTVWDADNWIDKPLQKEGESEDEYAKRLDEWRAETHLSIPIVIQAIHPANIMPDPYFGGQLYVIERHKKFRFDAERIWPHWENPLRKKMDDEVEYLSYWDKDYRCDLVDGDPVLKVRGGVVSHKYGFIPYTLIESGLGNVSQDAEPEKRYVGILRYIRDMLISESTNYSLCDILMKRETMKGGYITGADAETVSDKVKQEYGMYYAVGDKDVQFHDWEIKLAPNQAYAHLALTHEYISAHAAPRSVRGLPETGVRAAADRRLIMSEAASIYRYASPAFAYGWANILSKCARLVKNVIPGDFEIWARTPTDEFDVTIKKSLLREPFNFYVEFAPISEEDEYRRHDDLYKLYDRGQGLVTKPWVRRQMSNIDPIAMEEEEEMEKLANLPSVLQIMDQYVGAKLLQALGPEMTPAMMAGGQPIGASPATEWGGAPVTRNLAPPIPRRTNLVTPGTQQELRQLTRLPSGAPGQGRGGGGWR